MNRKALPPPPSEGHSKCDKRIAQLLKQIETGHYSTDIHNFNLIEQQSDFIEELNVQVALLNECLEVQNEENDKLIARIHQLEGRRRG